MESEIPPVVPIHLKVEINCKEHFNVLPMQEVPFSVSNKWYQGECNVLTYQLDELVGTKLRALYQRRKGRDLYDLYKAVTTKELNIDNVLKCYHQYMDFVVDHIPTYKEFIINMEDKMQDEEFLGDTQQLLRPDENFNPQDGYEVVRSVLIDRLQK
jgi:predicted nucleotidyltransferase component of viral defense system